MGTQARPAMDGPSWQAVSPAAGSRGQGFGFVLWGWGLVSGFGVGVWSWVLWFRFGVGVRGWDLGLGLGLEFWVWDFGVWVWVWVLGFGGCCLGFGV